MALKKKINYLIFAQNFVTYHSSMYREFFKFSGKKSLVAYLDKTGLGNIFEDRWGKIVKWKLDLREGFKSIVLNNFSLNPNNQSFLSRINFQIPFLIWKIRPKKIFFQGYSDFSSWLILYSAKIMNIEKIAWKGERVLYKNERISNLKKFVLKNFFFKKIDEIYFSCRGNYQYLKNFEINEKKLNPMLCSVNNKYFQQNKLKKHEIIEKRIELKIKNNYKIILIVSNFENRKNVLMFLNLAKFTKSLNYHYIIVGSGKLTDMVKKKVLQNKNRISYLGFVDTSKISEIYSIADLFMVISEYDPSPKTLNEALNFNIPCIVYKNVGTAYDLIKNNTNGFILDKLNEYCLLSQIRKALNNNRLKTTSKIYNKILLKKYSPIQNAKALINDNTKNN